MSARDIHMYNGKETGKRIKKQRRILDMTSEEFAFAVGCSPSHIYGIETGMTVPSLNTMMKIAEVLGVGVDELLDIHPAECQKKTIHGRTDLKKYLTDLVDLYDSLSEEEPVEEIGSGEMKEQ